MLVKTRVLTRRRCDCGFRTDTATILWSHERVAALQSARSLASRANWVRKRGTAKSMKARTLGTASRPCGEITCTGMGGSSQAGQHDFKLPPLNLASHLIGEQPRHAETR